MANGARGELGQVSVRIRQATGLESCLSFVIFFDERIDNVAQQIEQVKLSQSFSAWE